MEKTVGTAHFTQPTQMWPLIWLASMQICSRRLHRSLTKALRMHPWAPQISCMTWTALQKVLQTNWLRPGKKEWVKLKLGGVVRVLQCLRSVCRNWWCCADSISHTQKCTHLKSIRFQSCLCSIWGLVWNKSVLKLWIFDTFTRIHLDYMVS